MSDLRDLLEEACNGLLAYSVLHPEHDTELVERIRGALAQQAQQPASPEVQKAELWEQMADAWQHTPGIVAHVAAAEIDVVAQWLARYGHAAACNALRLEARRARGEA